MIKKTKKRAAMAGGWRGIPLGQVAQINPDAIDNKWPYAHINYIDISSVGEGQIDTPPQHIEISAAPGRAKRLLKKGDTVLSTVRPNRRSMFFASNPEKDWVVSTGFAVLRPKSHSVEPRFLYACVFNQAFTDYLVTREKGAAYPAVSSDDIASAPILLPPLDEQRAIAKILGDLDDKIDLNRRMNKTLEAMAQALFKSWFVDFEPVRAKMEGRWKRGQSLPGLPAELYDLFPDTFVDSELGKIPRGWGVGCVDDDFNLTMGQSPPGNTYNEIGDGTLFFQGRTDFGFRYPAHRVYCTSPTRFAKAGDTLVSVRAPVGDINMALEKCCIGRGVAAIRHKSGSRSYTHYVMRSLSNVFQDFEAEGTVFGCINKDAFQNISHLSAPAQVVEKFEAMVFPLDNSIENNIRMSEYLVSIRDTLLPKILSGEMRLKM